jgi:hypothetical protein
VVGGLLLPVESCRPRPTYNVNMNLIASLAPGGSWLLTKGTYMSNLLVRGPAVVLQDVVVNCAGGDSDLLRDGLCTYCEFMKTMRPRIEEATLWQD